MEEEEVAKVMGYKTTEKGRKAGYKQLKNLKKIFKEKAINILKKGEVMAYETAANSVTRTKGKN
jgi:vacuolar-type H+-ATPase subunit H